jgi:hypothetical protein
MTGERDVCGESALRASTGEAGEAALVLRDDRFAIPQDEGFGSQSSVAGNSFPVTPTSLIQRDRREAAIVSKDD